MQYQIFIILEFRICWCINYQIFKNNLSLYSTAGHIINTDQRTT